ncbi:MAG: hypothetical protein FJ109_18740 [Deltaproteobacteria bacterium]|nr:hypothetical protein [Deltaproteobacteria bacterium]
MISREFLHVALWLLLLSSCGDKRTPGDAGDCGPGSSDCGAGDIGDGKSDGTRELPRCDRGADCGRAGGDLVEVRGCVDWETCESLSDMAKSFLACEEKLWEIRFYRDRFPLDVVNWCCALEEGLWVLKQGNCGGDSDPGCGCGPGFTVEKGESGGCAGAICVPEYPDWCVPERVETIMEDCSWEGYCPAEAPFCCPGDGKDFPVQFCTDCPCAMLPGAKETPCHCGEWGDECLEHKECYGGECVDANYSWTGKVCGGGCGEECPQGWNCKQVRLDGPDVAYTCVHEGVNVCRPCSKTKDCEGIAVHMNLFCADFGPTGSFCVPYHKCWQGQCGEDGTCVTVLNVETGEPSDICLPGDGSCGQCQPKYIYEQAVGTCPITSEFGTCPGTQTCMLDGLTECKGKLAKAEVCNNHDDDCDGETDEGVVCE